MVHYVKYLLAHTDLVRFWRS